MTNVDDILERIDKEFEIQAEEGLSVDDMPWAYEEPVYVLAAEVRRLREDLKNAETFVEPSGY